MAQIIRFPKPVAYNTIRLPKRKHHEIWLRILDRLRPEEARWHMQFAMQRAASFKCLAGFTDGAARRRKWHEITVRAELLPRFLMDIERLVVEGRVVVIVDDVRVSARRLGLKAV